MVKWAAKTHLALSSVGMSLLLGAAAPATAAVLFSDDFNSGASVAWGNQRGNWRSDSGVYDATNPNNSPLTYSSVTTLPALSDFSLEVDVNDFNDGGIWLRSDYNGGIIHGVLLVTGGASGTGPGLYWHVATDAGVGSILNSGVISGTDLQGQNVHLRVDVAGNVYRAYVGGTLVTTLIDNTYASGQAGLYDYSPISGVSDPRRQTFDNFLISDDAPSSVSEPGTLGLAALGALGLVLRKRTKG